MGGISLFLVEKDFPGIKTRRMEMQGSWSSGTSFVFFENVKVPVENLIGKENEGFKYVMYNFNHERWAGIVQALRFARICYEDSYRYAFKRKTFGKQLIEHQVIRAKLGDMVRQIESASAWLETITHQMCTMSHEEQNILLGGDISFLKVEATKIVEFCAREAVQIFGGLGYTRGGQGERVERIYRDVRVLAIGGGSEEVMLDFGVRAAMRISKL
jgi:alkylation response protein AidB-like acyl-CoA dehydrogenase